jgi:L-histidine N-alpha-methyltransferase
MGGPANEPAPCFGSRFRQQCAMSSVANVIIHASQFPEQVRQDLLKSLRDRQVNHKFHYDSVKQTQKWLALHQAYSPSRTDEDCAATYDLSFAGAVKRMVAESVHLTGLGCGGGQKDTRLLKLLKAAGKRITYTPSDVSVAMVLVARGAAMDVVPDEACHPLVCDLSSAMDVGGILKGQLREGEAQLLAFFGMIPNFEPQLIVPRLAGLMRSGDWLLLSANLAPGPDYEAGVRRILPLYDNELTKDWLITFLLDLGVERQDGAIQFVVEDDPAGSGLKRVAAYFHFNRDCEVQLEEHRFTFKTSDAIRLFFSYRHTPEMVRALLGKEGIEVLEQWVTKSEEEGVFLCRRA